MGRNSKDSFSQASASSCDQIVIAGGGLAGLFSAYELLRQAREAGKKLDVVVLADKINAPCSAGSHVVLEHEGLFDADMSAKEFKAISNLLRSGMAGLEATIERENIDCSYSRGYEWKAKSHEELVETVNDTIARKMYRPDEFNFDRDAQQFNLPGYDHSVRIDAIGQVNTPKLLNAIADCIRDMGGRVIEGVKYKSQAKMADGRYLVNTDTGLSFIANHKPLIATGAAHMNTLPGISIPTEAVYTMGIVMGPLSPEDRVLLAPKATAMCDTNMDGDVLWGGIDDQGNFTLGRGDSPDGSPERKEELAHELSMLADSLYPGISQKYPPQVSFGAMLVAENHLPVVGRMQNFDVMGGWAGEGIVPGYAAAQAYAKWVLKGDDRDLSLFETLQPQGTFVGQDNRPGSGKNQTPPPVYDLMA